MLALTMWTLLLFVLTTGSPALLQAAPVQGHSGRCSFAGVLHVEGTRCCSLTFQQALELCQSLDYKLATQEQIIEAYKKGLRTCRYGWIDGQNVMFLPHVNGLNCDSGSNEVTFHPKAAEYLSDVYCFNPSGSSLNCEDTVKSNAEGVTNGNTATENGKPHEDILKEVKTEGFLVDLEEIMGRVRRETSLLNDMEVPRSVLPDVDMKPSTVPTLDTKGPTNKPRFGKSSSTTPSVLFSDTEGSASGSGQEPSQSTMRSTTTEAAENKEKQKTVSKVNQESRKNQIPTSIDFTLPPYHPRQGEKPSTWLIIFAFCVVVGAIVCILAAIATRDKWYGPRQSRNITTEENNKDYSKTETLPLSEKEQEIVTLMSITNLNGKTEDHTATCLDEHEKEYLM